MTLIPVTGPILAAAWRVLEKEHIYEADTLQIASSKDAGCDVFICADGNLLQSARNEGLQGLNPVRDEKSLTAL